MRLWVRLLTLCLSLVLLGGGMLLHETANAKMSFAMAAADVSAPTEDSVCPACALEDAAEVVCDLDCSVPAVFAAVGFQDLPSLSRRAHLIPSVGQDLRGLDPGVDPTPPRSTLLS